MLVSRVALWPLRDSAEPSAMSMPATVSRVALWPLRAPTTSRGRDVVGCFEGSSVAPTVSSDLEEMFDVTSLLTEDLLSDALTHCPKKTARSSLRHPCGLFTMPGAKGR